MEIYPCYKIHMETKDVFKTIDPTGLRIAFVEYTPPSVDGPIVTLLPMIHVADKPFYTEADHTARTADVYLFESAAPSWLTWAVSRMFNSVTKRFSLTPQARDTKIATSEAPDWTRTHPDSPRERTLIYNYCDDDGCQHHRRNVRLVWADLDQAATRKALKRTTFMDRLKVFAFLLATPLAICFMFKKDSRDELIQIFHRNWTNPRSSSKLDICGSLSYYILDTRDEYLAMCLRRELDNPENAGKRIVVNYGGGHMEKLHLLLENEYGCRIRSRRSILAVARSPEEQLVKPDRNYGSSEKLYIELTAGRIEASEKLRNAELARKRAERRASKFVNTLRQNIPASLSQQKNAGYAKLTVKSTVLTPPPTTSSLKRDVIFGAGVDTRPDWRSSIFETPQDDDRLSRADPDY